MTSVPKQPEGGDDSDTGELLEKPALEKLARPGVSKAAGDFGNWCYWLADLPEPAVAAIVCGIVSLAGKPRLQAIADGAEIRVQARSIAANACPDAQGDLVSAAVPAEPLTPLMVVPHTVGRRPACGAVMQCGRIQE
jgi:hypothetical protein